MDDHVAEYPLTGFSESSHLATSRSQFSNSLCVPVGLCDSWSSRLPRAQSDSYVCGFLSVISFNQNLFFANRITLNGIGWVSRTTMPPLLVSVNHLQMTKLIVTAAGAFGRLCSFRTVVNVPGIHMWWLLRNALRVERMGWPPPGGS